MVTITLLYGVLITALGIIGYFATGQVSKTALIPCVFGLPIIALAIVSWLKPNVTKQTRIAALVVALLALAGTVSGLGGLITLLTGGDVAQSAAVIVRSIMAIASVIYVVIIGVYLFKKTPNRN